MSRIAIIGAGIGGLATAALLAREGHDVTVYEAHDRIGGRAGRVEREGFVFDTGPSWYLMPEAFEHFFEMLGENIHDHLDLVELDPAYRVYGENAPEPLDIRSDREDAIALFESVEPGAGERLAAYLDSARFTYTWAIRSFLYTTFQRVPLPTLMEVLPRSPLLARLLLESLHSKAAKVADTTLLQQVLGYAAVFLASEPRRTPSMYHLMSAMDLEDGVRYPQGGFHDLLLVIAGLAEKNGARIRLNAPVEQIRVAEHASPLAKVAQACARRAPFPRTRAILESYLPEALTASGHVTGLVVRGENGREFIDADVVVSAADLHHTETQLLPPEHRTYPETYWDAADTGPAAVLGLLGVKGELPQLQHHTLLFTEDWDKNFGVVFGETPQVPSPASVYVCKPSATDPSVAPEGYENLFLLIPVSPDTADGAISLGRGGADGSGDPEVEMAVDQTVAQIADWAGIPDLAERVVVRHSIGPADFVADYHSWRGNLLGPAHTLKQSAFLRGANKSSRLPNLLYAGATTLPGVGLPMCLISAENVLKRLRGDTSDGPMSPLPPRPESA